VTEKRAAGFPDLGVIRDAILAAPPVTTGFLLHSLRDAAFRQTLRAASHLQSFLEEMRIEAVRACETPLQPLPFSVFQLFETTGDRADFELLYFDRRRRLAGLTLATVIDDTDEYLFTLSDLVWEICNEYTWALPAHLPVGIDQVIANPEPPEEIVDLFAAHTAHMLAEVVSLLGDRLPGWLHYRIRTEVEQRVFQPMFHESDRFWWETARMNWASVCGGCVGMAALILIDDRERLTAIIDRAVRTMECFLDGFGADGGCPEGISYWVYGFGFFVYFAEMLSAFTAGQIDLMQSDRVRQIAAFPQVVSLGGGNFVNFSDAPERALIHPGLGSRLVGRLSLPIPDLKPPRFSADHVYRWGHITRDLLWADAAALGLPVTAGSFYLDDLAWVVDRRVYEGNVVAFAAKGGHNDEPHNHNDLGHFILHVGGESLLADLGAGLYTRQYFRQQRYESVHTGSHGHSVPLINGKTQQAGRAYQAATLHYERRPNGIAFGLDLTHAYEDQSLQMFVRTFNWSVDLPQRTAMLRVTDTFQFRASGGQIVECFISFVKPVIAKKRIEWPGKHSKISMSFDSDALVARVIPIVTHMHHREQVEIYNLQLHALTRPHNQFFSFDFEVSL
jgi:hypothetical protein